jgi:DNA-binding LytR/AlgR family response regulator
MDILIIEDEINTAQDLKESLERMDETIVVLGIIDSIEEALIWFRENKTPDLIYSDIQLADGLSFEIFEKTDIKCPIIFCTAYDEYAIKAFDANGIDYILKPFNEQKLDRSFKRFKTFQTMFSYNNHNLRELLQNFKSSGRHYKNNFLVSFGEKMLPLEVSNIVCFYTEHGITHLFTFQNNNYIVPYTLEHLEKELNPKLFFRANRQFLISFKAIKAVEPYFSRKLFVHSVVKLPTRIIVSKQRASTFLQWMEDNH